MADRRLKLLVITPERSVYDDYVTMATLPGSEGYFGVLVGHAPLVSALKVGVIAAKKQEETTKIAVSGGFVEVQPEQVTVLADTAELPDWIDIQRAEAAKERAEERIAAQDEATDIVRAKAALERALTRLSVVQSRSQGRKED